MATNYIIPFAVGNGATVVTDTAWAASGVIAQGFQNGVADPHLVNKALRQGTAVASGVGQFVADFSAQDFSDSLSSQAMRDNFRIALAAALAGAYVGIDTSQTPNTVNIALNPAPPALNQSFPFYVLINNNNNTGATNIDINGNGLLPLVRRDLVTPQANDLIKNRLTHLYYDNTLGVVRMVGAAPSESTTPQTVLSKLASFTRTVVTATGTFSVPWPTGAVFCDVRAVGPGAGGGISATTTTCASGGSAGCTDIFRLLYVSGQDTVTGTLGAPGAGSSSAGSSGSSGGISSITYNNVTRTFNGPPGGLSAQTGGANSPGVGSIAGNAATDNVYIGGQGRTGYAISGTILSGQGGDAPFGGTGGVGGGGQPSAGNFPGGGGGGSGGGYAGGAGAAGQFIFDFYGA